MATQTPAVGSCSTIRNYFEKYDETHWARAFKQGKFLDSLFKGISVFCDISFEVAKAANASPAFQEGTEKLSKSIKDARTVFSLLNVLQGGIPSLYCTARNVVQFTYAYFKGDLIEVKVKVKGEDGKPRSKTVEAEDAERICTVIGEFGRLISTSAFLAGFGALRPAAFVYKHFKESVSESARKMGEQFGLVMFICHISTLLTIPFDIARGALLKGREIEGYEFVRELKKNVLKATEKFFEIGVSVIALFAIRARGVALACAAAASIVGCYQVWDETRI